MTARAQLDHRMRRLGRVMYVGVGLFLLGILIGVFFGQARALVISLPGFAFAFVASMMAYYGGIRCPRCQGNLGPSAIQEGWLRVSRRICFCPFCGVALDEELPTEAGERQ